MTERVTRRKKKEEKATMAPQEPISKIQKSVTHWLKRNLVNILASFLDRNETNQKETWQNIFLKK
jgi:hypothetical protein